MVEELKNSNKTVGLKQSIKAVEKGLVKKAFIASDADEKIIGQMKALCEDKNVDVEYIETMQQLGKACGIEVGAAVACLLI